MELSRQRAESTTVSVAGRDRQPSTLCAFPDECSSSRPRSGSRPPSRGLVSASERNSSSVRVAVGTLAASSPRCVRRMSAMSPNHSSSPDDDEALTLGLRARHRQEVGGGHITDVDDLEAEPRDRHRRPVEQRADEAERTERRWRSRRSEDRRRQDGRQREAAIRLRRTPRRRARRSSSSGGRRTAPVRQGRSSRSRRPCPTAGNRPVWPPRTTRSSRRARPRPDRPRRAP